MPGGTLYFDDFTRHGQFRFVNNKTGIHYRNYRPGLRHLSQRDGGDLQAIQRFGEAVQQPLWAAVASFAVGKCAPFTPAGRTNCTTNAFHVKLNRPGGLREEM